MSTVQAVGLDLAQMAHLVSLTNYHLPTPHLKMCYMTVEKVLGMTRKNGAHMLTLVVVPAARHQKYQMIGP